MAEIENPTPDSGAFDDIANLLSNEVPDNEPKQVEEEQVEEDQVEEGQVEEGQIEDTTWGKAIGVDDSLIELDDDGNFKGIKTNVNGETQIVDLPTLVAGWQYNKANTQKAQELASERKQFEEVRNTVATEYTQKLESLSKLTEHLHGMFLQDFKGIDWDRLRIENPGEYAAVLQDYNLKKDQLQRVYASLEEEKQKEIQTFTGQNQEKSKAFLKEQVELLIRNNPEWKDTNKLKQAFTEMSSFVNESYGFTQEEFGSVQDARIFELVKDAMAYRKAKNIDAKKVIPKPAKFIQPGKANKASQRGTRLQQLTERAKKSTGAAKRHAEADAIAQLLLGD